jgi:hypothetical protein
MMPWRDRTTTTDFKGKKKRPQVWHKGKKEKKREFAD